jgi:hypothetical protein
MVLFHAAPGAELPSQLNCARHEVIRTDQLRKLPYPRKVADGRAGWDIVYDGHTDLLLLEFWRRHPGYDRYWSIEYDVRFSGRWDRFLGHFDDSDADFLAASLRRQSANTDWEHWRTLSRPASRTAECPALIGAFMPVIRVTNRALQTMDAAYRAGWGGHCELLWPTILALEGRSVEDFGGQGEFVRPVNRGLFYDSTIGAWDLAPGSLVYRPVRSMAGWKRNRLWHPVKSFHERVAYDLLRSRRKLRRLWRSARTTLQR